MAHPVIDCHAHFDPRILGTNRVIQKMDDAGVDKVVFIPAMNDPLPPTPEALLDTLRVLMRRRSTRWIAESIHRRTLDKNGDLRFPKFPKPVTVPIYPMPDNEPVSELLRQYPDRFLAWIFLNPKRDPNVLETLERYREFPGYIGVKLHPHWHDYKTDILGPVLSRCEELKMPVLIHLGFGKRGDFRHLATAYPKLNIIAAHAGFPFYDDLWGCKNECPNLYVDLSSPYINEKLARAAVLALGPERCLFGTDAPYGEHEEDGSFDYNVIRGWMDRLPVAAEKRDEILGTNFLRLTSL